MELKPCPFCGGKPVINKVDEGSQYHVRYWWYVQCSSSECVCGVLSNEYETEAQAAEAWNTRAERTCKDATSEEHTQAFTCSECGCWVAYDEYWETGIYVQGEGQAVHIHPRYCPNCGAKVVE